MNVMKKIKQLFVVLCVSCLGSSCQEWLTIQPETQVTKDEMFKTPSGFNDVGAIFKQSETMTFGALIDDYVPIIRPVMVFPAATPIAEPKPAPTPPIDRVYAAIFPAVSLAPS